MTNDPDRRIRERAYAIWEQAGRPDGQHEDHWHQASQELAEDAGPIDDHRDHSSPVTDREPQVMDQSIVAPPRGKSRGQAR